MRLRRLLIALVACAVALTAAWVIAPAAGAGDDEAPFLLNDSPMYVFTGVELPTRNAPVAVASMNAKKVDKGIDVTFHDLAFFAPTDVPVTARVVFYGRGELAGGVEFKWGPGSGPVETTLVERTGDGTGTSPEVWDPADEPFGTVKGRYTDDGIGLVITPKGSYSKLVRDPYTAIGFDFFTDRGSSVQPSARVSIGDLTGTRPGLVARQGTGVGQDGSPMPWVTLRYARELGPFRLAAALDLPDAATVDIGKLVDGALQIRLFIAEPFTAVAPGERFAGYQLVLYMPTDTSVRARTGDAFASEEDGPVTIAPGKRSGSFKLDFAEKLQGTYAAVQTVVPGDGGSVLVATSFRLKF